MPEIFSSSSCILLMMLMSIVPVHLPRLSTIPLVMFSLLQEAGQKESGGALSAANLSGVLVDGKASNPAGTLSLSLPTCSSV